MPLLNYDRACRGCVCKGLHRIFTNRTSTKSSSGIFGRSKEKKLPLALAHELRIRQFFSFDVACTLLRRTFLAPTRGRRKKGQAAGPSKSIFLASAFFSTAGWAGWGARLAKPPGPTAKFGHGPPRAGLFLFPRPLLAGRIDDVQAGFFSSLSSPAQPFCFFRDVRIGETLPGWPCRGSLGSGFSVVVDSCVSPGSG